MKKTNLAFKKLRELISEAKGYHFGQAAFAKSLGVSRITVARIETGKLDVSQRMKDRIKFEYGVIVSEDSEHPKKYADELDDDLELQLVDFELSDVKEYKGPSVGLQAMAPYDIKEFLKSWLDCLPSDKVPIACVEAKNELIRVFEELTGKKWKDPNAEAIAKQQEEFARKLHEMVCGPLERARKGMEVLERARKEAETEKDK